MERGRRVGLFRGTYVEATGDISVEQRELAAVLASCPTRTGPEVNDRPTAVACLRSAARVWDLPLIDDDDPSTQATEHLIHDVATARNLPSQRPRPDEHTLTRHRMKLTADEVVRRPSGLWVTTAHRTALDCAAHLSHEAAVCLLDAGLHRGLLSKQRLQQALDDRRGHAGVVMARAALAAVDHRAESVAETLARLLLLPHLPGLVPQWKIRDAGGDVIARVDLADKEAKLAIEVDSKRWHSGGHMVAKDRRRDRRIEPLGWWTERITWHELRTEQDEVVARILARRELLLTRAA